MRPASDAEDLALPLSALGRCFEGSVPAVIATAAADGTPNVTYLSRVRMVDDERIALSNQFFSKTARNLAENPRASVLLIDPTTYDEYRLVLVYERTERRGPVFERLREDVDLVAALSGMQDVFHLRSADIYRVLSAQRVECRHPVPETGRTDVGSRPTRALRPARLAELSTRLSRSPDLDALVSATLQGLDDLLGFGHSLLMLLDETGRRLYTIGVHGEHEEGIGSEVVVGEGPIGLAAQRCAPLRVGNLRQVGKYSRTVRRAFADQGIGPGHEIPVPLLDEADSRVAVPAMARGQLVGVLVVESRHPAAFDEADEALLTVVASLVAAAVETERALVAAEEPPAGPGPAGAPPRVASPELTVAHVRFFPVDGSTFLDGDYLIKGVAGRLLWSLLSQHLADGRVDFTNREVRLDPSPQLPEFRDNFESRLILLKRRLDEHDAPVRIEKTGRGRFRLRVEADLRLESAAPEPEPPG